MAGLHAGTLQFDCRICTDAMRIVRGCDGSSAARPVFIEQYNGQILKYYSCPILFIESHVRQWYMYYSRARHHSVQLRYEEIPEWYYLATDYYESEYNKEYMRKMKTENTNGKSRV